MSNAIHDELLEHTSFLGDKEAASRLSRDHDELLDDTSFLGNKEAESRLGRDLQVVEMWKYSGVYLGSPSSPNFSD